VRALAVLCLLAVPAHAERPWHGSVGAGGMVMYTGYQGDRWRFEAEVDIEPKSRFGALVAWRGFDPEHRGILLGGLVYEAGAARPLLVIDLHADAGADLDQIAPVVGGGIRITLTAWGPFGVALDTGGYLVIDGIDGTRLVLGTSLSAVVRW